MYLIRSILHESKEALIVRFLKGLNYDIRDVVELYEYLDLQELVLQISKVEQQLKGKENFLLERITKLQNMLLLPSRKVP